MLQKRGVFLLFSLAMISSALLGIFMFYDPAQPTADTDTHKETSSYQQ